MPGTFERVSAARAAKCGGERQQTEAGEAMTAGNQDAHGGSIAARAWL